MRLITFYTGSGFPVFPLSIFAKSERIDLSAAERRELKSVLRWLAAVYEERN